MHLQRKPSFEATAALLLRQSLLSQLQTIPFNKNVRLMRLGFAQMAAELVASRK